MRSRPAAVPARRIGRSPNQRSMYAYRCQSCGAALLVRVPFKGRLVWTIDENDPDFGGTFPEPRGEHGKAKLVCSSDVLHDTGFHLVEGAVERDPASKAWD